MREKYANSYRKEVNEGISSNWNLYEKLKFLSPFVSLKQYDNKPPKSKSSFNEIPHITKSPFDELFLIQLVKRHSELYDKKHEDFRSTSMRKKAWENISNATNWNVDLLQKRWRVMRDRFVRELRRTQNFDGEAQVNCSPFFREMLFLARHVRSNKYEVETSLDESVELRTISELGDEDMTEEWIMQDETSSQEDTYDNSSQCGEEIIEIIESKEHENQDDEIDCIEDETNAYQVESKVIQENDDEENIQENSSEIMHGHWINADERVDSNKRTAVEELDDEHNLKNKKPRNDIIFTARTVDNVDDKDEDIAFGKTLGCMLKKIPPNLKTAVKLKLLSSLAEFEAQHNLT